MSRKVFFKLIVPNYNNIAYIKTCLDSIIQQTFQNFICVVVDDMSTDMSDKFIEYYERRYPGKIKLIKQTEKKYAGGARNTGLKYDKYDADYIWFIDSDDKLYGNDVLQKMHDKIVESGNPDVLRVGSAWNFNSRLSNKRAYTDLKFIIDNTWHAPWWSCINSKFTNVEFQEGLPIYNDSLWFAKLLDIIDQKKVVELDESCYVYNCTSSTGCHNILKDEVKNDAKKNLEAALDAYKPKTELSQMFIDKIKAKILGIKSNKKKCSFIQLNNDRQTLKCDEKIIVSMTSWKKRISMVVDVVNRLFKNTVVPDKIILNLSEDEFSNKEKDLPLELIECEKNNDKFEIYWVKKNTKPYKKTIHTIRRFPNDVIITVDDDTVYPLNFIETMLKYYNAYERQCPITAGTYKWENNLFSHYGGFSLIKKEFVGDYLDDLYDNLVLNNLDDLPFADPVITYAVLLNGRRYRYTNSMNMSKVRQKTHNNSDAISKLGTNEHRMHMEKEHALIREYILKKYNKTYEQLLDSKIIVNVTTYPARDKNLYTALQSISTQLLKPDEIILHLAEDEYDKNNIPANIQKCIDEKLVTQICWTKKNTYCFKRYNALYKNSFAYNIVIDDDIQYRNNFIQELISTAKKNQDCIINTATTATSYDGAQIKKQKIKEQKSYQNAFMGGCTCFPPYIFPTKFLFDNELCRKRDAYVKKCDESWFKPVMYKFGIQSFAIRDWSQYKFNIIASTQDKALYSENSKKTVINNMCIREKERNFFNAIKLLDSDDEVKQIFKNISIDNWRVMPNINDFANAHIKQISSKNIIDKITAARKFNTDFLHIKNTDNPTTMTEKIRYICTYGILDDVKCMCADKLLLHDFSKYVLGKDICIPIIKTIKNINDINTDTLPQKFVLKANHGCGFNMIYDKPNKYSNTKLRETANRWLQQDLSIRIHETHYARIIPQIYIEQYMNDGKDAPLTDYKFLCFNGLPMFCQIINDRHTPLQRLNYYNMKFEFVDICRNEFKNNPQMLDKKPKTWNEMYMTAMKFASYFDFVRVDLYEINGKVYLGELTFTPGAGKFTYKNPNDNIKLGKLLKLNNLHNKYYDLQQRNIQS